MSLLLLLRVGAMVVGTGVALGTAYLMYRLNLNQENRERSMQYTESRNDNSKAETKCKICLSKLNGFQTTQLRLPCAHTFHFDCLKDTFINEAKGGRTCPNCLVKVDEYFLQKNMPSLYVS